LQNVIRPTPAATGWSITGLSGRGASLSGLIKSYIYFGCWVGEEEEEEKRKQERVSERERERPLWFAGDDSVGPKRPTI
jgi:hypothetical protein